MGVLTDGKHWLLRWPGAGEVKTTYPYAFTLENPDHLLFEDADVKARAAGKRRPEDRFADALVVEESKRFGLPLDARDPESGNRSRTPHGQILRYLSTAESETDGDLHWGFLTNGGVWRLYDYRARPRATAYYEAMTATAT